jgi:phosphatidylglycerophosphatase A
VKKWIVTFGGAGMSPVAPGTVGSLATAVMLAIVSQMIGVNIIAWYVALAVLMLAACSLCVWLGPWASKFYGRKDAQPVVLDEVAGVCLTLMGQPYFGGMRQMWSIGMAFLMFRVFDIIKPPPARQLERLPEGWGVLLDDLAAAVYANVACQVMLWFFFFGH